jgi:hypothetical protein
MIRVPRKSMRRGGTAGNTASVMQAPAGTTAHPDQLNCLIAGAVSQQSSPAGLRDGLVGAEP